ncbi:peptide/nickel transport system permease protein [Angulomicrobium tetraedrale]|uniref:Peptide/nickel transport system permease protein n=1 Tax=Ancylobacter tetraedralis TaxID=217068 RepID=A0A839Z638_9HYPH|nr:ABC transporter permease [Ancylobacter tetraedralis]MBB3770030.1 peptide/nickel transport system permease protein [Ancylobacter tetraedralis]
MSRFIALARTNPSALVGLALLLALAGVATGAGVLYPGDPMAMVGPRSLWPLRDAAFPLGTDQLGRDVAAQLCHAARVSLSIGVGAAILATMIGVSVGALAGYAGGRLDDALTRLSEYFQTIPTFLFSMVLVAVLAPSIGSVTLAIGLTAWPEIARLTRAEVFRIRRADYVLAAETMGLGHARIIATHILPNSLAPVIVMVSAVVAHAILVEAALAFLGLGDPNTISWGSMIGNARPLLRTAWYLTALPGLAIFVAVMGFVLLGGGVADLLNPRMRVRRTSAGELRGGDA